jgi:hypothetical protein
LGRARTRRRTTTKHSYPTSQIEGTGDEQADSYLEMSDSDETTSIEADLNNTDFSNIDAGIEELE